MNSKQKGKRGELEWAAYCRQQGYDCRRTAQYCGNTGDASDVVGLPGIHQEVKRVEHLNIYEAIEQAERDKKDFEIPIVAHRKNRFPWLVTMKAEDWFRIYREFERRLWENSAKRTMAAERAMTMYHKNRTLENADVLYDRLEWLHDECSIPAKKSEHGANCPICGAFFNQEHAARKPQYCEDCGCRLGWQE